MLYNTFKKIGLSITFIMFIITLIMIIVNLIIGFVESIIQWVNNLIAIETQQILCIIVLSIVIIFTLGIILYLLGEVLEFFFGKYNPILLESMDYKLSDEDRKKISIMIPAYNEEKSIKKAIDKVKPFCNNVIVINDGSSDNTKRIALENGAIVVDHKVNLGLGQALRDGIKRALTLNSDIIINFDADLQYRAEEIPSLVYYILNDDYDLVMGSRFAGKIEEMSRFKIFGNKMYTKLLRYLSKVGISDGQTGFRAFTKEFAQKIRIRGDFTYTQEMILEATTKKFKIGEVPIHFDKRFDGKSRLMKNPLHFAKSSGIFLIKVLIDLNPLKIYALFSSFLLVIGFYIGGMETANWLITGNLESPFMVIIGIIIIMSALIIICMALLSASTKRK